MTGIYTKEPNLSSRYLPAVNIHEPRKKRSRTHDTVTAALVNQPGPAYTRRVEHPMPLKTRPIVVASEISLEELQHLSAISGQRSAAYSQPHYAEAPLFLDNLSGDEKFYIRAF
jgi:hypothetical protein